LVFLYSEKFGCHWGKTGKNSGLKSVGKTVTPGRDILMGLPGILQPQQVIYRYQINYAAIESSLPYLPTQHGAKLVASG
jgi:hypothetical protein